MAGQRLILVRHAMPDVRPGVAPSEWELGERAREDSVLLAHAIRDLRSPTLITSPEQRARQTADVLGLRLGCWPTSDERLREVRRPWVDDLDALVGRYLGGEDLAGWEPRSQVVDRVRAAIARVSASAADDLVVVTHGLALALYLGSLELVEPLTFWESLEFPCALAVDSERATLTRVFPDRMPR